MEGKWVTAWHLGFLQQCTVCHCLVCWKPWTLVTNTPQKVNSCKHQKLSVHFFKPHKKKERKRRKHFHPPRYQCEQTEQSGLWMWIEKSFHVLITNTFIVKRDILSNNVFLSSTSYACFVTVPTSQENIKYKVYIVILVLYFPFLQKLSSCMLFEPLVYKRHIFILFSAWKKYSIWIVGDLIPWPSSYHYY